MSQGCPQKQGRLFIFGGIQGLTFIPGFFQRKSRIDMIFFCLFPLLHLAHLVAKFMFGAMAVLWLALAVPACMLSYQD